MKLNDASLIGFALYLLCGMGLTYNIYNCPANKDDEVTLLHYLTLIFFWPIALIRAIYFWIKIQKEIKKTQKEIKKDK